MESSPALVEFPEEITLDDTQAPSVLAVSKAKKRALAYFADTNRLYAWGAKLWVIPTYQPSKSHLLSSFLYRVTLDMYPFYWSCLG